MKIIAKKSVHKGHTSNFKSSEFKDVINNKKVARHRMKKITSKNHKIYTQDSNKTSLSCFGWNTYFSIWSQKIYQQKIGKIFLLIHNSFLIPILILISFLKFLFLFEIICTL